MNGTASYLSDSRYGCDFVVATTQASINSSLWEYLAQGTQPVEYISILSNLKTGEPDVETTMEELLKRTGGVSPFEIPADTPYSDPRIKYLNKARFMVGIKIQMGIPPGCTPSNSPPIVTLGDNAASVTLNLYCAQITVVQNHKDAYDDDRNSWNVWTQVPGDPWIIQTKVNLVMKDLDTQLNKSKYLTSNPALRKQLRDKLVNLSDTAFSLQQLMFDLDNATLHDTYAFNRVPHSSDAKGILEKKFLGTYVNSAREHGWPLVSVAAVAKNPDKSTLQMTGFERLVSPPKGWDGSTILSPSPHLRAATTLDYICAINHNQVPSISKFTWNWVLPDEVGDHSGVIAINRNILARHIASRLKATAGSSCHRVSVEEKRLEFGKGEPPEATLPSQGSNVVQLRDAHSEKGYNKNLYAWLQVDTQYALDVFFEGSTIRVVQSSKVHIVWAVARPREGKDMILGGGPESLYEIDREYQLSMTVADKVLTDIYSLSVAQNGGLQLVKTDEKLIDHSDHEPTRDMDPATIAWYRQSNDGLYLKNVLAVFQLARDDLNQLSAGELHELPISQIDNFVFPGARVFTYKEPVFSDHQDLVCKITYLDPSKVSPAEKPQEAVNDHSRPPGESGSRPPPSPPAPAPRTGTVGKLTASTELMQNYVHGQIVSPTEKFEALQTDDGHTLLFAIDSSGVFHVIEEQSGTSQAGWQLYDLSTIGIQTQFPGQESKAKVRTFDVNQSSVDGSLGLLMVVHLDCNDHLFTSLGNSSSDTSWIAHPTWTMLPFDPISLPAQKVAVTNVLFAETQEQKQYLVVDIERPEGNKGDPHITRYRIDPGRTDGHYWVKQDVTVDIASSGYQSVVGRISGKPVDGIYTAGTTGGQPQLVYEPIINYYGEGPVSPRRLQLPGGAIPSAIATARRDDGSTDLYVVGGSALYCLPAYSQNEDSGPIFLLTSKVLRGTDTLRAMTHDGVTTLWGRTTSDQVYYLTTRADQPNTCSAPVPILSGIERISPYVNRSDGGNTIFASGNGKIQKLIQGSAATGATWRPQEIAIPAPPERPSTSFMSYTTSIHVTQLDTKMSAPRATVNLSADTRTPVYINGLYYVLSTTAIQIVTDSAGSLTIVDATDSLHGAVLTASLDNTALTIRPTDRSFAKLAALDSADKLRSARFPSEIVAGGVVGSPELTPLVAPSVSNEDVEAVAMNMAFLRDAYARAAEDSGEKASTNQVSFISRGNHGAAPTHRIKPVSFGFVGSIKKLGGDIAHGRIRDIPGDVKDVVSDGLHDLGALAGNVRDALESLGDVISTTAGDLFQAMKNGAETVGRILYDAGSDALHFLGKIGGEVYHAVLDGWHAVVNAAEWLWGKVKAGWQLLCRYLQMLFNWGDIRRTKDVMHSITKLWLQDQVNNIPRARQALDRTIADVETKTNEWANIGDWSPSLGEATGKSASSSGASALAKSLTPNAKLLADQYRDNAHRLRIVGDAPGAGVVENLLNDLLTAVSNESQVLGAVFNQLQTLITQFSSLSVQEVLQRLAVIIVDGTLSSVQVVIDTLLKVLAQLAQAALSVLDTKIHIPGISDLLNTIGVHDISFLDLFTWIGSMAVTTVYKIAVGHAPFPKGDDYARTICAATVWDEVTTVYGELQNMPSAAQQGVFMGCHMFSAVIVYLGNVQTFVEAEGHQVNKVLSIVATIVKIASAATTAAADVLIPIDPVDATPFKTLSKISTGASIGVKLVFCSLGQKAFGKLGIDKLVVEDARGLGAVLDGILVIPDAAVTLWHFYELTRKSNDLSRSTAISSEVGKLAKYVSRIAYAVGVNDEEENSKQIALLIMAAANDVHAGLLFTEAGMGGKVVS